MQRYDACPEFKITLASKEHSENMSQVSNVAFAESFERPWSRKEFESTLQSDNTFSFIVESLSIDGKNLETVGYILVQNILDEAEILSIAIHPKFRRMGLAEKLCNKNIEILRDKGVKKVYLDVRVDNYPAISFYKKSGFSICGKRKNYYHLVTGEKKDALLMALDLTQ